MIETKNKQNTKELNQQEDSGLADLSTASFPEIASDVAPVTTTTFGPNGEISFQVYAQPDTSGSIKPEYNLNIPEATDTFKPAPTNDTGTDTVISKANSNLITKTNGKTVSYTLPA